MRAIIISDALTPPLYAPRVQYLCEALVSAGYEVTLIVEKSAPIPFQHSYPILEIPYYRTHSKAEWAFKNALSLLFNYKQRVLARRINKCVQQKPDLLLVSTFSDCGLLAAYQLSQRWQIPFSIDLRDLIEQSSANEFTRQFLNSQFSILNSLYRKLQIRRRNRMVKQATLVTTVSPWHTTLLQAVNPCTHLIYNGFNERQFHFTPIQHPVFEIVYTGKWYSAHHQDPTLLFEALQQLNLPHIRLSFYTSTDCQERFQTLAKQYNISHLCQYHDYIPRNEIPAVLNRASIVLVLSSPSAKGVLTTKFFEAVGAEKPVLCVHSDNGDLHELIQQTQAGLSASTVEQVVQFIENQYAIWQTEHYTHQLSPIRNTYSRQNQTSRWLQLLQSI